MIKLKSITFENAPRMPGVRPGALTSIECDVPHVSLRGWRFIMRGAAVYFVSPPGWKPGLQPHEWATGGVAAIHEVPRAQCFLQWEGDAGDIDAVLAKGKYESEPFGGPVVTTAPRSILAQLDPSQMGDP